MYCSAPWVSLHVRPNGDIFPCCISGYCLGNILKDSWNDIQAGEKLEKLKEGFLSGDSKMLQQCGKCYLYTEDGGGSPRLRYNRISEAEGLDVLDVDVRLSNKCNLACRMCGPYSSSRWEKELGLKPGGLPKRVRKMLLELIKENAGRVRNLNLVGGEPTIIPEFYEILKFFKDNGYASSTELCFNTNLHIFPLKFYKLTTEFKKVDLAVSIDATGKLNDWIRTGSSWQNIETNLQKLQNFFLPYSQVNISIAPTISILNIFQLDSLFQFGQDRNLFVLDGNLLFDPKEWCLAEYPQRFKVKIVEYLRQSKHIPLETVNKIITFLDSREGSEATVEKALELIKDQTAVAGNYFKVAPEQKQLFYEKTRKRRSYLELV